MEILRNLFGNLTSGIIRLAVTGGILVLIYFLAIKPITNSANNAIKAGDQTIHATVVPSGLDEIGKTIEKVNHQVQAQIKRSFHVATTTGSPHKLVRCIKHAHGNVQRIQRCTAKF